MTTPPIMSVTDEMLAEIEEELAYASELNCNVAVDPDHMEALLSERAEYRRLLAEQERIMQSLRDSECALMNEVAELKRDAERLDAMDALCEGYGFEGIHEGNRWMIDGPFRDIRTAIDAMTP